MQPLLTRNSGTSVDMAGNEGEIALEAADEAVVGALAHLDAFRGESLFTTRACQFAVNELIRRRRWRSEPPVEAEVTCV